MNLKALINVNLEALSTRICKIRCNETYNSPITEGKHNTNFKSLLCMLIKMFPVFHKLTKIHPQLDANGKV